MNLPKISVVIPSFNKGKRIEETLKSIFKQKYPNLEVIVMDGGSNDETLSILKKYKQRHKSQLIWVSKSDNGQLDAVNKGLRKATGDILTFINADDVYRDGVFDLVSDNFSKNPKSLWFAGKSIVINENGKEIAPFVTWYKNILFSLNKYNFLLVANYLMQPSVFLTKNAYQKYGPFTGTKDFIMEYDLWLKIGNKEMPKIINKEISKFRIEKDTKTKTMSRKILKEDQKIVKKYTSNIFLLFAHSFHNILRVFVGYFI